MSKRRAFTLWEILIILSIIGVLAALLFPVLANLGGTPYPNKYRAQCSSNLKRIGLALREYTVDYDDKFPPLTQNWAQGKTQLKPYILDHQFFHCLATYGNGDDSTDYFFNANLAGKDRVIIADPNVHVSALILAGDGDDDHDQSVSNALSQLPDAWRTNHNSPAWRHLDGANYLFADGHVKWFKAEKITLDKPELGYPTFLVKP